MPKPKEPYEMKRNVHQYDLVSKCEDMLEQGYECIGLTRLGTNEYYILLFKLIDISSYHCEHCCPAVLEI